MHLFRKCILHLFYVFVKRWVLKKRGEKKQKNKGRAIWIWKGIGRAKWQPCLRVSLFLRCGRPFCVTVQLKAIVRRWFELVPRRTSSNEWDDNANCLKQQDSSSLQLLVSYFGRKETQRRRRFSSLGHDHVIPSQLIHHDLNISFFLFSFICVCGYFSFFIKQHFIISSDLLRLRLLGLLRIFWNCSIG